MVVTYMPSATSEQLVQQLSTLVGAENIAQSPQIGATAVVAVAPMDTQQVADVLRHANNAGLKVRTTGSGTKLSWGNAVTADILLRMDRMNAVREHAWEDLTAIVDAGCTWATMQQQLAERGQYVALDPLWPEQATIGGIVAVNDSGSLRLRYGSLRDLIIGMTIVLPDGTIAKTGGKVVKNVAGYDLHKLMTGAYGTLGVITQVNFRLHPLTHHEQSWTLVSTDADALGKVLASLLDSQMVMSSSQLRSGSSGHALDVRFASLPECLAEHHTRLQAMAAPIDPILADVSVWGARESLFMDPDAIVIKAAMLPARIAQFSSLLQQRCLDAGLICNSVTQATGLMTASLLGDDGKITHVLHSLRNELDSPGSSLVVLRLPDALRGTLDVWGAQSDALPLMRRIKQRFDPASTLNPGIFIGGI